MKLIWRKKEFTLLIIPGANRRTVTIKLPHLSLYVVPGAILFVLVGFLVTIYVMRVHFKQTTTALRDTFYGHEQQLATEISSRDKELEKLQTNLIELSQQADDFKSKLEEIKKLKALLTLLNRSSGANAPLTPTPASTPPKHPSGGAEHPVSPDQVSQLVADTKSNLTGLVSDINVLLVDLTESEAKLQKAQALRNLTPTIWPAASRRITSGFGVRLDPFTRKPSMHTGLDIDGELNDPVYAAANGQVTVAAFDAQHGNHIVLDHTRGLKTEYMHLNKMLVKPGDQVTKGQRIGLMGTTGRSTGTHLHYEVQRDGAPVNPAPYLLTDRKDEE